MSLRDSFRIGSNTKTMTSTVILQLVQEGKLKLNDPIVEVRIRRPERSEDHDRANCRDAQRALQLIVRPGVQRDARQATRSKAWTPGELLRIAFAHPSELRPGTKFEYSNTNIVLLGVVVEKLTGMSASEAFQKRIFGPLGMKHTPLPSATDWAIPSPHAQGYQFGTQRRHDQLVRAAPSCRRRSTGAQADQRHQRQPVVGVDGRRSDLDPGDLATYVKALVGGGLLDRRLQRLRLHSIRPDVAGQRRGRVRAWHRRIRPGHHRPRRPAPGYRPGFIGLRHQDRRHGGSSPQPLGLAGDRRERRRRRQRARPSGRRLRPAEEPAPSAQDGGERPS